RSGRLGIGWGHTLSGTKDWMGPHTLRYQGNGDWMGPHTLRYQGLDGATHSPVPRKWGLDGATHSPVPRKWGWPLSSWPGTQVGRSTEPPSPADLGENRASHQARGTQGRYGWSSQRRCAPNRHQSP